MGALAALHDRLVGPGTEGRRSALSSVSRELQLTVRLRSPHLASARYQARDFLVANGVHPWCIADILLALTEATANAALHSGCDAAEVRVTLLDDHVRLSVADRGTGFDLSGLDLYRRPSLMSPEAAAST